LRQLGFLVIQTVYEKRLNDREQTVLANEWKKNISLAVILQPLCYACFTMLQSLLPLHRQVVDEFYSVQQLLYSVGGEI